MAQLEMSERGSDGGWIRLGGVCAIGIGLSYVLIIALYSRAGAPPHGAEPWLEYLQGNVTVWWGIVVLSVFTDLLLVPVALALHLALAPIAPNAMRLANALIALFVVLDLAVTWPAYATLLVIAQEYGSATRPARAACVSAAGYAASVLSSPLELVYAMGMLSLAILIVGVVMWRGPFSRAIAWLAVATGLLGVVSCGGSGLAIIGTSLLTTVWLFAVGVRLCTLSKETMTIRPSV